MKTTLRRILTILLIACMALSAVSLIACSKDDGETEPEAVINNRELIAEIGGCSETYTGTVSEKKYDKIENAFSDFVSLEMAGNEQTATVVDTKSEGKLDDKAIDALNLPEADKEGIKSVEKFTVSYSTTDTASASNIKLLAEKRDDVVVYIISYGDWFKYFSPIAENGDTVSKSYYDSIFNAEKYKNCTLESSLAMTMTISAEGQSSSYTVTTTQICKFADNKIYVKQKNEMTGDIFMPNSTTEDEFYIYADENGETVCYMEMGGTWHETSLVQVGFESVDQLTPFAQAYLDHTYFAKTSYGCSLTSENFKKYIDQALSLGSVFDSVPGGAEVDGSVDYFVSNGVLSAEVCDVNINMTIVEDGQSANTAIGVKATTKCTNYGTTTVELPDVK